jgi:hypothetical protein
MSTLIRESGIQSLHDQVVSEVAQRWAKSFQCKVTIHTETVQPDRSFPGFKEPDIVGWQFSPEGNRLEWVAEVETEESLADAQTLARLQKRTVLQVPFYLIVPRGYRQAAQLLAMRAGLSPNGLYEYAVLNGTIQLT